MEKALYTLSPPKANIKYGAWEEKKGQRKPTSPLLAFCKTLPCMKVVTLLRVELQRAIKAVWYLGVVPSHLI